MDRVEQLEKRRQQQLLSSLFTGLIVLCIMLIVAGVGWHYFYGPCGVMRVRGAEKVLREQFQIYDDAYNIAASTARISLAQPVAELQKILRDTERIEVPACMDTVKNELVLSIDAAVKGFLAFMQEESDSSVSNLMNLSTDHMGNFNDEMDKVNECKPFCKVK